MPLSKIEAVRQIIDKHGIDTMPVEISRLAKSEHGVTITPGTASNYKSSVLKKLGSGGKPKTKRGPKPGWKRAAKNGTGGISVDDVAVLKKLIEQVGAKKIEQLARVLAK